RQSRLRRGRARAGPAGRSGCRTRAGRAASWTHHQAADLSRRVLDLDDTGAGGIGGESVADCLAGLTGELDVIAVKVDLLGLVGRDVDCQVVALLGRDRVG